MPSTVRGLVQGPALGDLFDRVRSWRHFLVGAFALLAVTFIVVATLAPLIGLLLLSALLMVGLATLAYSRGEVHGHGRLVHGRGHRR
jgi:uncharacterized membrane protein